MDIISYQRHSECFILFFPFVFISHLIIIIIIERAKLAATWSTSEESPVCDDWLPASTPEALRFFSVLLIPHLSPSSGRCAFSDLGVCLLLLKGGKWGDVL